MCYPSSANKGADHLRSNCEADQHLCFRVLAKIRVSHDAAHFNLIHVRNTTVCVYLSKLALYDGHFGSSERLKDIPLSVFKGYL